jgi:hypothetical protein
MTTRPEDVPGSFVIVFFRSRAGELRCRVTDVAAQKSWAVQQARRVLQLLVAEESHDAKHSDEI